MSAEMDVPKQSDGSPVPEWVWFDISPFTSDHWDEYEFEDSVLFVRADVHKAEIERLGKVIERQAQIVAATEDERNTLTRQLQAAVEERDRLHKHLRAVVRMIDDSDYSGLYDRPQVVEARGLTERSNES